MKNLVKLFRGLIYVLPLVLFFSYYPVISFGSDSRMNFELSLPLVWLVVFDVVVAILMMKKKVLFKKVRLWWLWASLPVWLTLSVIWSPNVVRGVLTVGILWLIYFAGYGMWGLKEVFDEEFRVRFWKWFLGATLFACGWCILQCVLDLVGVSREYTLMCAGCTYRSFGFPHPNGFAIEPQFMGNLLLAPILIIAWVYLKKQNSKNLERKPSRGDNFYNRSVGTHTKFQFRDSFRGCCKNHSGSAFLCSKFLLFCFFIITTTLFLTFSRGAIYAFVVGVVFLVAFVIAMEKRKRGAMVKRVGVVLGVTIVAFLFALNLQGIMAEVSPTNDTYATGIGKVINHLSLGAIDLPVEKPVENSGEKANEKSSEKAEFDGYVTESTDVRLMLTDAAIKTWSQDFRTTMFGVGIGGAGQAMYERELITSPKEIVQNQYASLLLETGIVGVLLFILTIILLVRVLLRETWSGGIIALIVAYGVSLCFFAGLPNALHIYLLPVIFYTVLRKKLVS